MSYPIFSKKYQFPSLVCPEQLRSYVYRNKKLSHLPYRAILCFSSGLAQSLSKKSEFQKSLSFSKIGLNIDLYKKGSQSTALVSNFGIGSSSAVICLEKLRVLGVKEFISVGIMGSMDPDSLPVGEKIFCTKALRDEGCSYHYKAPSPFVGLQERGSLLAEKLKNLKLKTVTTWTTDAPFRETKEEVIQFKNKMGIQCVDMESAGLMVAGEYYHLPMFCLGVISDQLSVQGWEPQFFHPLVKQNLLEILDEVLFI